MAFPRALLPSATEILRETTPMPAAQPRGKQYGGIIEGIFFAHWKKGIKEFEFERTEIEDWAHKLKIKLPKNLGDLLYSFRFRAKLPRSILDTEPVGMQWHIQLAGKAHYRFKL